MTRSLQIRLGEGAWHLFHTRALDEKFQSYRDTILLRDTNVCQYCGFTSAMHMVVVNDNHDYLDNRSENMRTACPLCAQVQFLEMVGLVESTGGLMIYLPDLSQAQLNGLAHVMFCAIANSGEYSQAAQSLYNSLKLQAKPVEDQIGKGLSDPSMLAQMLIDAPLEQQEYVRDEVLRDLRVLPLLDSFAEQIKDWSTSAMGELI